MKDSHFYYITKLYKATILYIILTALNHGVTGVSAFIYKKPINFVELFFTYIKLNKIYHIFTIIIGICALIIGVHRDTYLTFLGETVFPTGILSKINVKNHRPDNATEFVQIKNLPPSSLVVYWAAEPSNNNDELLDPEFAYKDYKNSGIAIVDPQGYADLHVRLPQSYKITKRLFKKILKPHIHYRYSLSNGMFSRIETIFL